LFGVKGLMLAECINKSSSIILLKYSLYSYPFVSSHFGYAYDFFTLMPAVNLMELLNGRQNPVIIRPLAPTVIENCIIVPDYYCCLVGMLL
jgi:hypothetical protein